MICSCPYYITILIRHYQELWQCALAGDIQLRVAILFIIKWALMSQSKELLTLKMSRQRQYCYIQNKCVYSYHFYLRCFSAEPSITSLKTEHTPWPKPRVTLSFYLNFNSYMYVLLSIAPGQCLISFLHSVTFSSGIYSVTLYFYGFNLNFSCVNNLHLYNLKERFLTNFCSKKD